MVVVCGTDFSRAAEPAITAAVAFAARTGADELVLVHVLDQGAPLLDTNPGGALHDEATRRLELEAQRVRPRLPRAIVRGEVRVGPPARELADLAERARARLIVVGCQGHGASSTGRAESTVRVGGTSARLAEAIRTPLLVVRDAAPFEAWARGDERPLRLLLALDRTATSGALVRWLRGLGDAPREVIVGHVYDPATERERYGLSRAGRAPFDADPEVERLLARDLAALARDLGEAPVRAVVGRTGDPLLGLAAQEEVDAIVVGTHHRRGLARLSSVASVVLHHATSSVVIVPCSHEELLGPPPEPGHVERVLVATDLSAFADHVVPLGCALLPRGGTLHLLHVVGLGDRRGADDARAQLEARIPPSVRADPGTRTIVEVVDHASPAEAIVEAAERCGADLVCLASHGHTWLEGALVGSVTKEVLRRCSRPVVVMHPPRR